MIAVNATQLLLTHHVAAVTREQASSRPHERIIHLQRLERRTRHLIMKPRLRLQVLVLPIIFQHAVILLERALLRQRLLIIIEIIFRRRLLRFQLHHLMLGSYWQLVECLVPGKLVVGLDHLLLNVRHVLVDYLGAQGRLFVFGVGDYFASAGVFYGLFYGFPQIGLPLIPEQLH